MEKVKQSAERYLSLDVFRGLTICLMIIVNTPGKGAPFYPFLVHAKWFGFTLADLVFPSFLFAIGTSMSFSFKKGKLITDTVFLKKVLYRSFVIFLLGFLMYWFPFVRQADDGTWTFIPFANTRIMGVLQRIALCYLLASLLVRWCSGRLQAIIAAAILLGYWAALYAFGDAGRELSMAGNAITKLDLWLLGEHHVYKKDLMPFDPEGVLSTLPAVLNVLAGYWIGLMIQRRNDSTAFTYLVILGVSAILAGSLWNIVFPISKKLWTSPFVLFTVGCDILVITALIYLQDLKHYARSLYFFIVLGKNPLFIYLLSELLYVVLVTIKAGPHHSVFSWLSIEIFQRILPGPGGALLTAIIFMLFCWLVAWWLDRKKIYIKI